MIKFTPPSAEMPLTPASRQERFSRCNVGQFQIAHYRSTVRITRHSEVGRSGAAALDWVLPGETESALGGRTRAEG